MRVFGLLLFVSAASAYLIDINYCEGVDTSKCTIHEIDIKPCAKKNLCKIVKGGEAEITFDFTPHFSTDKLTTEVIYQTAKWSMLNPDGCLVTTCPTVAGTKQTYHTKMPIKKKLPNGKFKFNWSLFDTNDTTNKCCFEANIKLVD